MKRTGVFTALILSISLLLCLCACDSGGREGTYRKVETLSGEQFSIAFRAGDRLRNTVTAAIEVLAANGTAGDISRRWFGSDVILIDGNQNAIDELGYEILPRTFIMGLDSYGAPMSFKDSSGNYTGFDVELARAVCELLGWELRFQGIAQEAVDVELASGNIDAAWGGMSFAESEDYSVSPAYMNNEKIIVARTDSGIKRQSQLEGKNLGIRNNPEYTAALDGKNSLREKCSIVIILSTERLFESLDSGTCDAILTDSAALDYYLIGG